MRILVGNHIDESIRVRSDMRSWTQRILWFAQDDDLVILPSQVDAFFLEHVARLRGFDPRSLTFLAAPPGRYGHDLLDPATLTNGAFVAAVEQALTGSVTEVFALWPSAQVARLSAALGVADRLPGAAFIEQGGGELVNNKACFRALAAGAGVPVAPGAVCRSPHEATTAMRRLLDGTGAVVVKQAHNGAGVGNEIVLARDDLSSSHVGARHLCRLEAGRTGVERYWAERWSWASADGRYPVVVEEFQPSATSIYSEYLVEDSGVVPTEIGVLLYVQRRLSHQIVPFRDLNDDVHERLVSTAGELARTYQALGYRGYLSADAVLTPGGDVLFTEINAQVSGSLHIYCSIGRELVRVNHAPQRSVVEYHVPMHWAVPDFRSFMTAVEDLGHGYDPHRRTGVVLSMPVIPSEDGRAQFVFCVAYATAQQRDGILADLDAQFGTGAIAKSARSTSASHSPP